MHIWLDLIAKKNMQLLLHQYTTLTNDRSINQICTLVSLVLLTLQYQTYKFIVYCIAELLESNKIFKALLCGSTYCIQISNMFSIKFQMKIKTKIKIKFMKERERKCIQIGIKLENSCKQLEILIVAEMFLNLEDVFSFYIELFRSMVWYLS